MDQLHLSGEKLFLSTHPRFIKSWEEPTLLTYVIHIRWTKKAHSTDQQLVEFTFLIAWEQCVARFNRAFGIEDDDVSRNGYCLAPVAR